jgi:putative endonuclease
VSDRGRWNRSFGAAAEAHVASLLRQAGLTVQELRFRCPRGEIDIVAREGSTLVFVEVKARRSDDFGVPEEAVGARKQSRLFAAARAYLRSHRHHGACRFDVVSVRSRAGRLQCEWIRDAFRG